MTTHGDRPSLGVLALAALVGATPIAAPAQDASRPLVLENVTLIDGTGAAPRPGMTVIVDAGIITSVLPADSAPARPGADRMDLRGKFLIPGLIDSHVHFTPMLGRGPSAADAELRRLLYGGVTTVRDAAGDARLLSALARAIDAGEKPGPDIYYAAVMGGPDFIRGDRRVARASAGVPIGSAPWQQEIGPDTDLRAAVARAKDTGATGIKFYIGVPRDAIAAIAAAAHASGMRVWAHATVFPDRPIDVVRAGVDVVSHLCSLPWQDADLDPSRNVPYTHTPADAPRPAFDPDVVDAVGPEMTALFREMVRRGTLLDATHSLLVDAPPAARERGCTLELVTTLARAARQAGVEFTTGTDYVAPPDDPYPAVLREIESLVDAQVLTPLEALAAATRNGARALGIEDTHGTIETGKRANLVVLSADPTQDIRALRTVEIVVKNGNVHRRPDSE